MGKISEGELRQRFTYHPPKDKTEIARYEVLRQHAYLFACVINDFCPPGYERDEAVKNVEQSVMWANAALARRGEKEKP